MEHDIIFGESQINNPGKWETRRGNISCRITIYCNSETQKEKIINVLRNEKHKHGFKKIGDALEKIIEEREV